MTDEITMDRLAKIFIKMQDKRAELSQQFDAQDEAIKKAQAEIADAMKAKMRALGVKSAGTEFGTVTLKTTTRFYATDWEAMYTFLKEHDAPHLLEKRIAQSNMQEFLTVNPGVVPPGLNTMSEVNVSVSKPKKPRK